MVYLVEFVYENLVSKIFHNKKQPACKSYKQDIFI